MFHVNSQIIYACLVDLMLTGNCILFLSKVVFFFLNFYWTHVHLWGRWYPCFGLQLTSPLGFKARVGSALFALGRGIRNIHSLRFTSGVTPLPVYNASIAASHLPHMRVSAEVGCRDLNRRPPARQSDALSLLLLHVFNIVFLMFCVISIIILINFTMNFEKKSDNFCRYTKTSKLKYWERWTKKVKFC